jgi:hypothetical protein
MPLDKPLAKLARNMTELTASLAEYHYAMLPEPKPEYRAFRARLREQVDHAIHQIGREVAERYAL